MPRQFCLSHRLRAYHFKNQACEESNHGSCQRCLVQLVMQVAGRMLTQSQTVTPDHHKVPRAILFCFQLHAVSRSAWPTSGKELKTSHPCACAYHLWTTKGTFSAWVVCHYNSSHCCCCLTQLKHTSGIAVLPPMHFGQSTRNTMRRP
eukprot:1153776-Pelagomonas_calceolata.AAC.2